MTKILQKTALFAGVLFGVLFIAIVVGRIFPPSHKIKQQQEWSSYIIDYINYEQSGGYNSWGLGYQTTHQYYGDINYRDKIVFKYYKTPQRQRLTLEYAACGISEGEVAIFLNEERLTYLPIVEACTYNLKVLLPADKIKTGNNLIIFDNLRNNNKGTETWLISYIKIREEAIPKADPAQAQQNFRLGMRMYDEREVDPRNRQKAIKHFRLVRDYLETLKKKPNLYREATRMIRIIDKQLQRRFQGSIFEAQRLVNYGKYERAKKIILKAMSYFESDKKDARYLKLQSALTQLSG